MGLGNRKWPLFLLTALFLFTYVLLTGLKPAALRAFIMILTGLLAFCLGREKDLPSALAAAGLLTLFYNPLLLFNVSFQFSYAAAAAIIVLAPSWQKGLSDFLNAPFFSFFPWRRQFSSLAAVTLAAQFGVTASLLFCRGFAGSIRGQYTYFAVMALVLDRPFALLGLLLPAAGSSLSSCPPAPGLHDLVDGVLEGLFLLPWSFSAPAAGRASLRAAV